MRLVDRSRRLNLSDANRLLECCPWRYLRWCEHPWYRSQELQTLDQEEAIPKTSLRLNEWVRERSSNNTHMRARETSLFDLGHFYFHFIYIFKKQRNPPIFVLFLQLTIIALKPRAPVCRSIANFAIALSASCVKVNSTWSMPRRALYCGTKAFFGSVRILTNMPMSSEWKGTRTGKRPTNSYRTSETILAKIL